MRKWLSCLVAAVMVLGLVPALAAEQNTEKYSYDWTTYIASPLTEDATIIKLVEDKFNVDINMLNIEDANFLEVLNTYIAGGDTPDVIRLKDPSQLMTYIDQGIIGSIDMDLVREHMPYASGLLDQLDNGSYWKLGAYEGVQYAIPGISSGNIFHLPAIYNKKKHFTISSLSNGCPGCNSISPISAFNNRFPIHNKIWPKANRILHADLFSFFKCITAKY
jgi:ABC-type glycerol-3-phosphate transport system substrate-binding protein